MNNQKFDLVALEYIYKKKLLPSFTAYYEYGRHAFFEILRVKNIGKGDKVLVPEFICLDVIGPIITLGAEPVFYKLTENLIPIDFPIDYAIKALLVVNYFGFPQDLNVYNRYCKNNNVILIEDNAHGFLSKDREGNWLGTRADFGIFSFRKTFFSINGGALWMKNQKIYNIQKLSPSLTTLPYKFKFKEILYFFHMRTGIPFGLIFESLFWFLRYLRTGSYFPIVNIENQNSMKPVGPINCHILKKIENKDLNTEATRRITLFYKVKNILSTSKITPIYLDLPEGTVPYGFAFRMNSKEISKVNYKIAKFGLYAVKWPDLPTVIAENSEQYYKNVFLINFI